MLVQKQVGGCGVVLLLCCLFVLGGMVLLGLVLGVVVCFGV